MTKTLALTVLVSLGMITCNFNFVFASGGNLPVFSSTPTFAQISESPVYIQYTNYTGYYAAQSSDLDYFYITIPNDVNTRLIFIYTDYSYSYYRSLSNGTVSEYNLNNSYYENDTLKYRYSQTAPTLSDIVSTTIPYLGEFSSVNDAIAYYDANGVTYPTDTPPIVSKYTFQNGWLSVIDLGASNTPYNFDLSTSFNVNSGIVSQNWSETSQTYWFSDILPTVESSYTNQGTLIPWERGTPRNVFGQTKDGVYTLSGTSTGRYLYILNPAFRAIADAEHPSIENHPVTVSGLTDGMKAYVYELTATATLSGVANAISTIEVDGQTVIANSGSVTAGDTSEDLTNSFVNSDNETIVQNQGGGNQNTTAQTINNYLENIQNVLDNFVNQFVGLLTAPISHIQQLISAGSNFFHVMAGLFSWLPSDLSSLVVSALSVCLVIGIIKMFL